MATKLSRFESNRFWDLRTPGAKLCRDRRINNLDSLKEAIAKERNKIPQEIIDKCFDIFKPRLRRVIEVESRHIERYRLLIIHIGISQYVSVKFAMILII